MRATTRISIWCLYLIFLTFLCVPVPTLTSASELNVGSLKTLLPSVGVIGKRISKSSSVRLARVTARSISISSRNIYLPAGKILLLTNHCGFSSGRKWCFSITEEGIGIFLLVKGEHYFKINTALKKIAVAQRDGFETGPNGEIFRFWTSRAYEVVDTFGQSMKLKIDTTEGNSGLSIGDKVHIADSFGNFALIDTEDFKSRTDFVLIRPVLPGEIVDAIYASLKDLRLSDEEKTKIKGLLSNKNLIESKVCDSEVEFVKSAEIGAGVDIGGMLTAINLKLGVTAKFSTALKYEKGTAFDTYRFLKEATDGSPHRFFEAWVRKRRQDNKCENDISSVEIIASEDRDFGGGTGGITTKSAQKLMIGISETNKLPRYTCSDEYFKIIKHLTQTDGQLTRETAELIVAHLLRFEDASNASRCKQTS